MPALPKPVIIEKPVINSPFSEPERHFKFDENGITNEIIESRRQSEYFIPVPRPKGLRANPDQGVIDFGDDWLKNDIEPNKFINEVRDKVITWRRGGYRGISPITRQLLEHWNNPDRENKLFFCQIEAVETAIYITEVAKKEGASWVENQIRDANAEANSPLFRIAFKMATGAGKTVVMAMLIAWHTLNKVANRRDKKFSDAFLIVTPGVTIRERLNVLLPQERENYYKERDIVPLGHREELAKANIVITNYHAFKPRKDVSEVVGKVLKADPEVLEETPGRMVNRVLRQLKGKKNIIVFNDEAHHCYRAKQSGDEIAGVDKDEEKEMDERNDEARIWISGIEAVNQKLGVRVVYDLSATPFFIKGAGYSREVRGGKRIAEGVLFPWVVSDFSLIDAIESGIVKVPRVPVDDSLPSASQPVNLVLWPHIKDKLPKANSRITSDVSLPEELETALRSLYGSYETYHQRWESDSKNTSPPVMIIVCNNIRVSRLVRDWVSGHKKQLPGGGESIEDGKLPLFSNAKDGNWLVRPNTILIHSGETESGEQLSGPFKSAAATEIAQFKKDYQARNPGKDPEKIKDGELLREVMNTVGKRGKMGEQIKCVISVSMLTEGWDAKTVTHILGVRAFSTQLLCEQVVGRGLRRTDYEETEPLHTNPEHVTYPAQFAEVYGIPFSFIPSAGSTKGPDPKPTTHVRALQERIKWEITFPRLSGYVYPYHEDVLKVAFGEAARYEVEPIADRTTTASILGDEQIALTDIERKRVQEVDYGIAREILTRYFNENIWLFPQLREIVRRWREEYVVYHDGSYPQLLLLDEYRLKAAERIHNAIKNTARDRSEIQPIFERYRQSGSTRYVAFDTALPVYPTETKCHISHVTLHSGWEGDIARIFEGMDNVSSYVKNYNLDFSIPYVFDSKQSEYIPDFILHIENRENKLLNLILEVSGNPSDPKVKAKKKEKVATANSLWCPAVNNYIMSVADKKSNNPFDSAQWQMLEISNLSTARTAINGFIDNVV